MSRFIPGDYVRPMYGCLGLPYGSVWVVRVCGPGKVELGPVDTGPTHHPASYVLGRTFDDRKFEKVILCGGRWQGVAPRYKTLKHDPGLLTFLAEDDPTTVRVSRSFQSIHKASDGVESADKLVELAAAALVDAKQLAREAREKAKADAKAEAKRKAAADASQKALVERQAISARLHKDRELALATVSLIAEIARLHNGGPEQDAAPYIAMHVEQLQPLAKSYGYKIAKPGVIAIVVKL